MNTTISIPKPIHNPAEKRLLEIEGYKKATIRWLAIFWLTSTVFIFLRILLEGLGSDPHSIFAALIYIISGIFLLPFWGIFPHMNNTIQPGHSTFDGPAGVAIFCNTILVILALLVTFLLSMILKTNKQIDETVKKDNLLDPTLPEKIVK